MLEHGLSLRTLLLFCLIQPLVCFRQGFTWDNSMNCHRRSCNLGAIVRNHLATTAGAHKGGDFVGVDVASLDAFEALTQSRWANTRGEFDPKAAPVPSVIVKQLLRAAQSAPSGFNVQPYKMIVVEGDGTRQRLAGAMLGSNARKVTNASFCVVFAADLESSRLLPKAVALAADTPLHGRLPSSRSLFMTRIYQRLFATGHRIGPLRPIVFFAKKVAFGLGSHVLRRSTPSISSAETWAVKNTMLAAQTMLLAATAAGLSTCPMEGFDGRRVRRALRIPRRYSIPLIVAVGYPTPLAWREPIAMKRFPLEDVAFRDSYNQPLL